LKSGFIAVIALFISIFFLFSITVLAEEDKNSEETNASGFFQSLIIIVREGFEAILIVGAISAYLVVSKNSDKLKTVYIGAVVAIIASLITAILIDQIFFLGVVEQELLEGITLLIAALVLLFVTNWMLAKSEAIRWQKYIKGKVEQAISEKNSFTLGLVSFFAVYREGFETVLFYKALLLQTNNPPEILAGFVIGIILLVAIFFAIKKLGVKIPINVFFLGTSLLLFVFAFSFIGTGIHELQEAGILSETDFELVPKIIILGLYPTVETLFGQLIVLIFGLVMGYVHVFKHRDLEKSKA